MEHVFFFSKATLLFSRAQTGGDILNQLEEFDKQCRFLESYRTPNPLFCFVFRFGVSRNVAFWNSDPRAPLRWYVQISTIECIELVAGVSKICYRFIKYRFTW